MRERHPCPGFLGLNVVARDYIQLGQTAVFLGHPPLEQGGKALHTRVWPVA